MKLVVTMKQLIVVVFILAILVSLVSKELVKRRNAFLYDMAYHVRREAEELRNLENLGKMRREKSSNLKDQSLAKLEKSSQLRVAYHSEMKLRFQSAANIPGKVLDLSGKNRAKLSSGKHSLMTPSHPSIFS